MIQRIDTVAWKGRSCVFPTRNTLGGKPRYGSLTIDLTAFSCSPESYLRRAIENNSYPMHRAIVNKFQRALGQISTDATAVEILNRPPDRLTSVDIVRVFSIIEEKVATWGDKSRHTMSLHARKVLVEMPELLRDGSTAAESGFTSRFSQSAASAKPHAAERPFRKPSAEEKLAQGGELAEPSPIFDAIEFNSLAERDSSAYEASAGRKNLIADLCVETFKRHDELVEKLESAKAAGLPTLSSRHSGIRNGGLMERQALQRFSEEEQLKIVLYIMERDQFHVGSPKLSGQLATDGLTFLNKHLPAGSGSTYSSRRELLMSDYYLPAHVVAACVVAIQNDKMVNTDVISGLTRSDVEKTKRGYRFVGLKTKTDQIQGRDVEEPTEDGQQKLHATSSAAVRAFDLLLKNAETIERIHGRTFVPLVICLNLQFHKAEHLAFSEKGAWLLIQIFCKLHNINAFDTRYLRHLGLQTHVLSPEGSIYSAQALAGHANINTTLMYIYTNVTRHLHLANIRRFMDMLAASILWRTGRIGLLEETGLDKRGFNLQLLFPLEGDDETEKSTVDEWLESDCTKSISVGLDELHQCAAQYGYYLENLQTLPQRNPHRFTVVHVPRILTCYALRNIILASPYAAAYRKYERQYL